MSEEAVDTVLFDFSQIRQRTKVERAKLFVQRRAKGQVFVDWTELPRHPSVRCFVIHWRSLNDNQSQAIRVSRKKHDFILQRLPPGHLFEIHVCSVNESDRILASSAPTQIQTMPTDEAPTLRVTKLTPDFIWLEWEKSDAVQLSQISTFELMVNGKRTASFPAWETRYVVNDGELGKRYTFQVTMIGKDRRMISSLPVSVYWPGATFPKQRVFVNGNDEMIITWGDSKSISDASIESYTVYLFDSDGELLKTIGPNSSECRQVWIKDLIPSPYSYILEIGLANSTRCIWSKQRKVECGQQSIAPVLTCEYTESDERRQLIDMTYQLLQLRDSLKSRGLLDKCEDQLEQTLRTLMDYTDSNRLMLKMESTSSDKTSRNHLLLVDGQRSTTAIPWFINEFPLALPRREKPYELAVTLIPEQTETVSNKVLVESSGHFSCFCAHFASQQPVTSCSYLETFLREKQLRRPVHQGLLRLPQPMKSIQAYDLRANRIVRLPSTEPTHRLSVILFYLNGCVPSMAHLNYFSTFASSHRDQHFYISINCSQDDLDALSALPENYRHIKCYTDFSSEQFRYERNTNEATIPEVLSIDGVPTYFVLDFFGRLVWRGRLCVRNQFEYDSAVDHVISDINQLPSSQDESEIGFSRSFNDKHAEAELNHAEKRLQAMIRQSSSLPFEMQQQERNADRKRQIISMKDK